jgi:hypothetical protein
MQPWLLLLPLLLAGACRSRPPPAAVASPTRSPAMTEPDEITVQLNRLLSEHVAEGETAAAWLIAHAADAEPRLRRLIAEGAPTYPRRSYPTLARMGRPESVPVLAEIMNKGPDGPAFYAAQALGMHPHADAHAALLSAVRGPDRRACTHALDALPAQAAPWACADVIGRVGDPDPEIRRHAELARGRLGCGG